MRAEELAANPGQDAVVRVPELDLELPVLLVPAGLWIGTAGDPTLKYAAAIIAGNTVAGLRPASRWSAYEGGSPTVGNRRKQFDIDRLLDALAWRGRSSSAGTYWRAANVGQGRARESLLMHLLPGSQEWREGESPRILTVWAATRSDSPAFIPLPLPCSNIWLPSTTLRFTTTPRTPGICCWRPETCCRR